MLQISFLRVGTIVPLTLSAGVLIFLVFYWIEYKRFVLIKNTFAGSAFFAHICEGYVHANVAKQRINKSHFWFWVFGSRYNDLLSSYLQRTVYELDKLEQFPEEKGNNFFWRHSFTSQWKRLHREIFKTVNGSDHYELKDEFGTNPFGQLFPFIVNKIFVLYKKEALVILRTKGYWEFSEFLAEIAKESARYPAQVPFCVIGDDINIRIVSDHPQEVTEKIRSELKKILKNSLHKVSDLTILLESYVLREEKFLKYGSDLWHLKNEIKYEAEKK